MDYEDEEQRLIGRSGHTPGDWAIICDQQEMRIAELEAQLADKPAPMTVSLGQAGEDRYYKVVQLEKRIAKLEAEKHNLEQKLLFDRSQHHTEIVALETKARLWDKMKKKFHRDPDGFWHLENAGWEGDTLEQAVERLEGK